MKPLHDRLVDPHKSPRHWKAIRWMRRVSGELVIWSMAVRINGEIYGHQLAVSLDRPDFRLYAARALRRARIRFKADLQYVKGAAA